MMLISLTLIATYIHYVESVKLTISSGTIQGTVTEEGGTRLYLFRGIPYAQPPINELRFRKPVPVKPWTGILDTTQFKGSCPQSIPYSKIYYDLLPNKEITEDCLYINVYVPRTLTPTQPKSVMVWVHGGGYTIGQGMLYDGTNLAIAGDVIVVTFNYRLGLLGFLSTEDEASPGNYGLWDQHLVFKWVKENIAAFGGNPESITIFGESSGGFSVGLHMLIPQNKGLFQRAIAESGSGTSFISLRSQSVYTAQSYARLLNCSNEEIHNRTALVECYREKSVDEIITAQTTFGVPHFEKVQFAGGPLGPVVDGDLIQKVPLEALQDPQSDVSTFFRSLDIIIGNVNAEGSLILFVLFPLQNVFHFNISEGVPSSVLCQSFAPDISYQYYNYKETVTEAICKQYSNSDVAVQGKNIINMYGDCFFVSATMRSLEFHAKNNPDRKSYQFLFSKTVPMIGLQVPPWFEGAPHESELFFLFGPGTLQNIYNITQDETDANLSQLMIKYWSNFAKHGNPNSFDTPNWPVWEHNSKMFFEFNNMPKSQSYVFRERMEFWLHDLPQKHISKYHNWQGIVG